MLKEFIYFGSYLYLPAVIVAIWLFRKKSTMQRIAILLVMLPLTVLAYARFVEPRMLHVHEETIVLPRATPSSPTIRIALFGDTHIGMFGNAMPLHRITKRLNALEVDAVFIAGDHTYYPNLADMPDQFAPLGDIEAPVIAVLGNHDVGLPGPDLTNPLMKALALADVQVAHNRLINLDVRGEKIIVAGTSDLWQRNQRFDYGDIGKDGETLFILTHNPDTASVVPSSFDYDLMLAGHTHGGQIRLPLLYQRAIPTEWPFDIELHHYPSAAGEKLVYVTSGTGMVGLPMRFNMPPRIDVLTIHLPSKINPD